MGAAWVFVAEGLHTDTRAVVRPSLARIYLAALVGFMAVAVYVLMLPSLEARETTWASWRFSHLTRVVG